MNLRLALSLERETFWDIAFPLLRPNVTSSGCVWSTTGRHGIYNRGSISRWDHFWQKALRPRSRPGLFPLEALAPYRVAARQRTENEPAPLPHLTSARTHRDGIDLTVEAYLESAQMRKERREPSLLSRGNLRDLYWTLGQLVAHHTSNGCNLRPGDLIATGTISGSDAGSEGCLLEKRHNAEPILLPTGETRTFLEDGDRITLRAYSQSPGMPRIGFGECTGTVLAARR